MHYGMDGYYEGNGTLRAVVVHQKHCYVVLKVKKVGDNWCVVVGEDLGEDYCDLTMDKGDKVLGNFGEWGCDAIDALNKLANFFNDWGKERKHE